MVKKMPKGTSLKKNEKTLWYGRRSWKSYTFWILFVFLWLIFGLVFPVLFILGLFTFFVIILKQRASEYAVTNKRVVYRCGFTMGKSYGELRLEDIHEENITQDMLGESLNYGDIEFRSLEGETAVFKGIHDPEKIAEFVRQRKKIDEKKKDKKILKKK